jgi:hypothetical protein
MLRSIRKISRAVRDDIADLQTRRALPTSEVGPLDPFLFLNHHGPQIYPRNNHGLPFGPHPHRGFETVTFILEGDIAHQDSGGHSSVIRSGGVQWMTAGRGLVHSEVSSEDFMKNGGPLEILQLWVNLPSKLKMTDPKYAGLQKDQIPQIQAAPGVTMHLVSGQWKEQRGAFRPLTDITLMTVDFATGSSLDISVPKEETVFFYLIRGRVRVNGREVKAFEIAQFEEDGTDLRVEAHENSVLLFGHARPYGEPIIAHGPFVMNTREEIVQAVQDYQSGKLR